MQRFEADADGPLGASISPSPSALSTAASRYTKRDWRFVLAERPRIEFPGFCDPHGDLSVSLTGNSKQCIGKAVLFNRLTLRWTL